MAFDPSKILSDPTQLITGKVMSQSEDKNARDALGTQQHAFDNIDPATLSPEDLAKYTWLQNLTAHTIDGGKDVTPGQVTAAQAQAGLSGPSAYDNISTDPRLAAQQEASLGALSDLASRGGLTAADNANLNNIQNQSAQADKARRDSILQHEAERGMGGSGNELLAQLASSQDATTRANQAGLTIAGQAQQNALNATLQGGSLAGQIQGQQFGQQAQQAAANDAISRFNAQQSQANNQYNTGALNQTAQYNNTLGTQTALANRNTDIGINQYNAGAQTAADKFNIEGQQGLANANVDLGNRQQIYNTQALPQANMNNQMAIAAAKSGAQTGAAKYWGGQADNQQGAYSNFVQGAGEAGSSYMNKPDSKGPAPTGNVAQGGGMSPADAAMVAAHGGRITGHAHVPGDSFANDTVNLRAAPGEVILPRTVVNSPHRDQAIHNFMQHLKPVETPKTIKPEHLADFLKNFSPKQSMHDDSEFSIGQKSYDPEQGNGTGDGSNDKNEEIARKLAALGMLSK